MLCLLPTVWQWRWRCLRVRWWRWWRCLARHGRRDEGGILLLAGDTARDGGGACSGELGRCLLVIHWRRDSETERVGGGRGCCGRLLLDLPLAAGDRREVERARRRLARRRRKLCLLRSRLGTAALGLLFHLGELLDFLLPLGSAARLRTELVDVLEPKELLVDLLRIRLVLCLFTLVALLF